MKLEKFKRKNNKKKIIIIGSVVLVLLIMVVIMYRSFAFFENIQEFNVIKGSVPDQNYDIMLSLTTEDENQNKQAINQIPEKNSEQKYEVEVSCNNNAIGSWNYEDWKPEINEFRSFRTKCTINFKENNDFVYPVTEKIEDGKKIIANAITQKGINTSAEATFETMANNINKISTTPRIYHLGTGYSFNISGIISNYRQLTTNNFVVNVSIPSLDTGYDVSGRSTNHFARLVGFTIQKNYNASNGQFTISNYSGKVQLRETNGNNRQEKAFNATCDVYVVY